MVQKVMLRSFSPEKAMRMLMTLEANMEKMTPIRMMVLVDREKSSR